MAVPHDHDLDLYATDVAELESPQRIAAFFQRLGYDARNFGALPHAAINLDTPDLGQKVKRIWRVAESDDGDLQVLLLETRSMAGALTRSIARQIAKTSGDYLLIVTQDFEMLDFVLADRDLQPQWGEDVRQPHAEVGQLLADAREKLDKHNEQRTRDALIEPLFKLMGFALRANKPGSSDHDQPDYDLFAPGQLDKPLAQALVYKWNRNLDATDPTRDHETPDENPAARVVSLLERAATPWVIVTNGKMWRLYSSSVSNKITNYYEIDLEEAIFAPSNDREAAFKFWWLLFRRQAFEGLLDKTLNESREYARQIGERLKSRVFEDIFIHFAGGFIQTMRAGGAADDAMDLDAVFNATMTFLYRLMFVLYAESLELLPVKEENGYGAHSARKLKFEIADQAGDIEDEAPDKIKRAFSADSTALYTRLLTLFRAIGVGSRDLNLPIYNGGLFSAETAAGRFLEAHAIPDQQLALGLDRLARDVDDKTFDLAMIDFKSLGVRQLGSIYEGLLEFKLRIAPHKLAIVKDGKREVYMKPSEAEKQGKRVIAEVRKGHSYLENIRQERKATGSYYTPDYIVEYIVQHSVGPVLDDKFEALKPRLREAQKRFRQHKQHTEQKNKLTGGADDPNKFWASEEMRRLADDCLSARVLDPAMGSGHFLVEAVDFISNRLIDFLNGFSDNPVWAMLERTRADILGAMAEQGVSIDQGKLTRVNLLKRAVLKRCVYGVDLNKMAVELAKVSLWLDAFTLGAPLSFLDHHLKHGNSLIGARAKEVQDYLEDKAGATLSLFQQSEFAGVMLATDLMRHVSELSDNTVEQVRQSADEFRKASDALAPYKRLLDVYTARWFGASEVQAPGAKKRAKTDYVQLFLKDAQTQAWLKDPQAKRKLDDALIPASEIARVTLQAAADKRFFHWELEFPEVFFAPSAPGGQDVHLREDGGFDAVVGNPPYGILPDITFIVENMPSTRQNGNVYVAFIERCLSIQRGDSRLGYIVPLSWQTGPAFSQLRHRLLHEVTISQIVNLPFDVFADAYIDTGVFIIAKSPPTRDHQAKTFAFAKQATEILDLKSLSFQEVPQNEWLDGKQVIVINLARLRLLKKLFSGARPMHNLGDLADSARGILAHDDFIASEPLKRGNWQPLFLGAMDRYEPTEPDAYVLYGDNLTEAPTSFSFFEGERILVRRLVSRSDRLMATIVRKLFVTKKDIYSFKVKGGKVSAGYLGAVLNSKLLSVTYLEQDTSATKDDFRQVTLDGLRTLPIPRIAFQIGDSSRKQLIAQAQTSLLNSSADSQSSILTLTSDRLSAGETDVVHDVLAFLAEQMMALNKRKQAEVKRFLGWLEKALKIIPDRNGETGISSLKKKSYITNYLGDYQKGEREAAFDDFLYWLHDNRNRFGVGLEGLRGRIEAEYEQSLAALLPIKRQLQATDALIDRIVYQLYGLSEDEIKLIEYPQFQQAVTTARDEALHDKELEKALKDAPAEVRADAVIASAGEKIEQAAQQFFERVAADDVEARLRAELPNWDALPEPVKLFLKSGEMVLAQSAQSQLPEYSGVAISFAKAAETALKDMLFAPFRAAGHTKADCANDFLKKYMDGGKSLTLGSMAIILPSSREHALRAFVQQRYPTSANAIFDPHGMLALLDQGQINQLRNASAHDGVLTLADAQAARAWAVGILGYLPGD